MDRLTDVRVHLRRINSYKMIQWHSASISWSEVTKLLAFCFSWLMVPSLQCLFSRLRKYLVFFSPSLYHLIFSLIMSHSNAGVTVSPFICIFV